MCLEQGKIETLQGGVFVIFIIWRPILPEPARTVWSKILGCSSPPISAVDERSKDRNGESDVTAARDKEGGAETANIGTIYSAS